MINPCVDISDLFSEAELGNATYIYQHNFFGVHKMLRDEVVVPAMAHINDVTGRENNPNHITYMLIYTIHKYIMESIP